MVNETGRTAGRWAIVGISLLVSVSALADDACTITSIRVDNPRERRIAPGEPITLLFEVDADCVGLRNKANREEQGLQGVVGRALSEQVELDDIAFQNRLSAGMLNEIVVFEPRPLVAGTAPTVEPVEATTRRTFSFVGTIFMTIRKENRRFVLDAPGVHTLVFGKVEGPKATVFVIVDTPTRAEKAIIEKLYAGEFLLTLASVDDCSKYTAERLVGLKQVLEQAQGTRYERYLSVAVGIGSMCELERNQINGLEAALERDPTARVDRESYEEELLGLGKFFEPANASDPASEFDISVLSNLASLGVLRAKRATSQVQRETQLAEVTRLHERLAKSRLTSVRWFERSRAQATLVDSIRAADRRSEAP